MDARAELSRPENAVADALENLLRDRAVGVVGALETRDLELVRCEGDGRRARERAVLVPDADVADGAAPVGVREKRERDGKLLRHRRVLCHRVDTDADDLRAGRAVPS